MTGQEARHDEREALARLVILQGPSSDAEWESWKRAVDQYPDSATASVHHRLMKKVDAILTAGYRRHPEPEITDEQAALMLDAINTYERECDRRRGDISQRVYGHRGASIPEAFPTREGKIAAMRAALKAAFWVPAREGEQ